MSYITLQYVVKFMLGTMKISLISVVAISRTNLFTETIQTEFLLFFQFEHFFKNLKNGLINFWRLLLCIPDVVNNVS